MDGYKMNEKKDERIGDSSVRYNEKKFSKLSIKIGKKKKLRKLLLHCVCHWNCLRMSGAE